MSLAGGYPPALSGFYTLGRRQGGDNNNQRAEDSARFFRAEINNRTGVHALVYAGSFICTVQTHISVYGGQMLFCRFFFETARIKHVTA